MKSRQFRRSNATLWETKAGTALKSYNTFVAWEPADGAVPFFLSSNWDCSVTTTRQVGKFLEKSSKQIRAQIKAGTILQWTQKEFDNLVEDAIYAEGA